MDNRQRLEQQADYIANNLTEWEAESIARGKNVVTYCAIVAMAMLSALLFFVGD